MIYKNGGIKEENSDRNLDKQHNRIDSKRKSLIIDKRLRVNLGKIKRKNIGGIDSFKIRYIYR